MEPGRATGRVPAWQPSTGHHATKLVLTCHDRLPLSTSACGRAWTFTAKSFSVNGLAAAAGAMRCFVSVSIATADSSIAVRLAAPKLDSSSVVAPTAATNVVPRDASIIATANASTAAAALTGQPKRA